MFDLNWVGIEEFKHALEDAARDIDRASKVSITEMAALAENLAKKNFQGSHKKGRPHVGGSMPNVVTGNLRRSITRTAIQRVGNGDYMTRIFPSTVYARAVELGNPARGSGAYPYFAPAMRQVRLQANDILARNWQKYI